MRTLHSRLFTRLGPDDTLVYLGNFMGRGPSIVETVDELLLFRRAFLARPRAHVCDVAYLRGCQEEMWDKLLQIQFAVGPRQVLEWMFRHGVAETLRAYGGDSEEALRAAGLGARMLTKWTSGLRAAVKAHPGHSNLTSVLTHAARREDSSLLFVSAGLDPDRPLGEQGDRFWWGGADFERIDAPFEGHGRVVRGWDPGRSGPAERPHAYTVDLGCGRGGPLAAVCFGVDGTVAETIEA